MKLAVFAFVIFVVGVMPGLAHYAGAPPDPPSPKQLVKQTQLEAQHPVLTKLTEKLKLRL